MTENSEQMHETGTHEEQPLREQQPLDSEQPRQTDNEGIASGDEAIDSVDTGITDEDGQRALGTGDLDAETLQNLNEEVTRAFESVSESSAHENSVPQVSLTTDQENVVPLEQTYEQQEHTANDEHAEQDEDMDEINTSVLQAPISNQQFATPLKSLPPLKDIEPIITPKSFSVARDSGAEANAVSSSPLVHAKNPRDFGDNSGHDLTNDDTFAHENDGSNKTVCAFLGVESLSTLNDDIVNKLQQKASQFGELKSENTFLKLNQEQAVQIQDKKFKFLQLKLEKLDKQNYEIRRERDDLTNEKETSHQTISKLREENAAIRDRLSQSENETNKYSSEYSDQISERDQEILKLNDTLSKLTKTNIEQSQHINQITKELNETRNDKFSVKLEFNKVSNEMSYLKNQKSWYEEELKSVQQRFTDLIKKHESEFLLRSNKLAGLSSKNEALERLNKTHQDTITELQQNLEAEISKASSLDSKFEIEKIKFTKELKNKDELLELTQVQSLQRAERIEQLESYIEEIKDKLGNSVNALEIEVSEKNETIAILEEKLRRTEEVLDEELHKETDLPKLSESAEMIALTHSNGISLSSLYSEYNHLKKRLVLERSQKERLSNQLESFVAELESKKPTIANHAEQVKFYENSLQEMIGKIESIRLEKLDSERECNKLKSRLSEYNNDLVSMKKLCKDLGKQLCYYLIHSKIRDSNEDPLTLAERKAIENILERSGNNDGSKESDTDQLISERLVGFASIIELQQKNEGLLSVVRQLGKKLESREEEFNGGLESAAIDEAKEAILTLESELDSINIKLEAVSKERDVLKSMSDANSYTGSKGELKFLSDANNDLKSKLSDTEKFLKELQAQSNSTLKDFNDKLRKITNEKNELSLKFSSTKHSADLADARFANAQKAMENSRDELKQFKKDVEFWKNQASKQESLLINKSNEVRDAENRINRDAITINNLKTEKDVWNSYQKTMNEDIAQHRADKANLNEFVINLQSLLKERELSSNELSNRLTRSIENYQVLQERLNEREERIFILSNQSELALKAQNAKLEQVNELSQQLLEYKTKMSQKTLLVESLTNRIKELDESLSRNNNLEGFKPLSDSNSKQDESTENILIELEKVKHDLRIAEGQVSEFSSLAKAAESALINSTNTFENFKVDSDNKCSNLIKEKQALEHEIRTLTYSLNQARQEFNEAEKKHSAEVEELKLNIQESSMKANAYDDMQRDFEGKFESIVKDLETQSKISSDNQNKYHQELQRNEDLVNQVNQLKNEYQNLESSVGKLKSDLNTTKELLDKKDEVLEEERQVIQEELDSSKLKLKDLRDQNNLLLNQLELSKLPSTSEVSKDSSNADLKEVVSYLRREKDAAEARLTSYSEDQNRLEQRLHQVSSELDAAKSELMKSHSNSNKLDNDMKEHNRLLEQVQQLNILRESNTTLRNENSLNVKRISELENELQAIATKLPPLEKRVAELSMQNDVKEQTIRLIKEENEKNKAKLESNGGNVAVDSDLEDIKAMKQRFTNLKNEFQNKLLAHRSKTKELEKTVDLLKSELADSNQNLVDAKSNYDEELAKVRKNSELNDLNFKSNDQLDKLTQDLKEARQKVESLQAESELKMKTLTAEKETLESELVSLKSKIDTVESNQPKEKALEEKLNTLKSQFEDEKSELRDKLSTEFENKLNEELSKRNGDQQVTQIRNEAESEFKAKYKDLEGTIEDRKLTLEKELNDKFEKELNTKVEEEVSKRISSGESSGDEKQIRDSLIKQHEDEITKLKEDFNAQLVKEKESVKNVTEKKYEIKLRMLNKKLDKLEGKKLPDQSNLVTPSVPTGNLSVTPTLPPTPNIAQVSPQQEDSASPSQSTSKLPLGHQYTESTLTVHRPTVDRRNTPPNKTIQNPKNGSEQKVGQKRPMVNKNQNANKRTKE